MILVKLKKGKKFPGFEEEQEAEWNRPSQPNEDLFEVRVPEDKPSAKPTSKKKK